MSTVLIVEDELFIANLYKVALEEAGLAVKIVRDGEEAIAAQQQGGYDLVLLDLLLPVKDGFAVLEWMKGEKMRTPVIVLTNYGQTFNRKRCEKLGAVGFWVKSDVDVDEVVGFVQKFLKAKK